MGTAVITLFDPNPWNPNKMDAFMFDKALESIREYGFIDPLTVRSMPGGRFQIIDGEHRWKAALELGLAALPFMDVSPISDEDAQKLTIVLNELRGRADPRLMGNLLRGLLAKGNVEDVMRGLPFQDEAVRTLTSLKDFDWGTLDPDKQPKPAETPKQPSSQTGERWVERTFRLPPDANEVLNEALARAREQDIENDWQALEMIAADFLAG